MLLDLRINGEDSSETEDFIPFVIKPPKGKTTSKLLFVLPSNSYMAYSNDNLSNKLSSCTITSR